MKLVRLLDAGQSGTPLGMFLGALMREFPPQEFVMVVGRLEHNLALYHSSGWTRDRHKEFLKHFRSMEELCTKYGLLTTASHTQLLVAKYEDSFGDPGPTQIDEEVRVSRRMLYQEMGQLCYMEIRPDERHYWLNLNAFGATVAQHFPCAADDIEEASKCIAVNRWTASAFHSLRVQEIAINAIYLALTGASFLPEKHDRSWGKVLTKISNELQSREKTDKADWKRWTPPLQSAYAFLNNAKGLWRDDTMHVGNRKDDKEAMRIYDSTRILMQHLAEWINEKGIFHEGK